MRRISFVIATILACSAAFAEFQAGVAVRVVTPDPLLPASGGLGTPGPTDEAMGDITVRAIVISDGDTKVAFAAGDFLGFPRVLGDQVREQVEGIPGENILIGATHTHSAPDMYAFGLEGGAHTGDLAYIAHVVDEMANAINDAAANMRPAVLKVAVAEAKGQIAFNYYADRLYDPRNNVLQFLDPTTHKAFATLINYAIHPEVLGADQGILSPDLCGPLYDRVKELGGGTAVFMNGAQGGMVTADVRGPDGEHIQTWEECVRIGNLLAEETIRIVSDAPIQEDPALACYATEIKFPIESDLLYAVTANSPLGYPIGEDRSVSAQVNVVNLGNAQILTIPGEALPNIGYYLKRNMKGEANFLFGLTNDAYGYILTKVDFNSFDRYDYISRTSLGEMTGEIYIEEALEFVEGLPAPAGVKKGD